MKEWNENKLDQELDALLSEIPEPEQDEFEKRVEKYINRRIRKIVHKTLAGILVIVILLLGIINPFLNLICLNPAKTNDDDVISIYHDVMRDYYETTSPFAEIVNMDVKKKGFARYEIIMTASDHIEPLHFGKSNVTWNMAMGKITHMNDNNGYLASKMGRFDIVHYLSMDDTMVQERPLKQKYIDQIEKLPESSKIYLCITAATPQTLDVIRSHKVNLEWIQIYQPNVDFNGGLSLRLHALHKETDMRNEMSDKELLDVYLSNLENLIAHKDMWRQFELPSGNTVYCDINLIDKTYEDAKTLETLTTKNYCIYGERDVILSYLENTDLTSVFIEDITLY